MKKHAVVYPFFFAAYSVLGMYSANVNEVRPEDVFRPLLFALVFAGLLLTVFYLFKRDWHHAGFLSVISVIALLYFGHSTWAIAPLFGDNAATYTVYAMIVFWGLVICLAWTDRLWKLIHGGPGLTFYLNITGLIVLIVPTIIAASDLIRYFPDRRSARDYAANQLITTQADPSMFPDIYFIILDGYGRQDVIQKLYGLDNSAFIDWLEEKGFYVANQSQSNYMRTKFALASTLNLGYLRDNDSRIQFLIEYSAVQNILENLGYTIIGMPVAFIQTQLTHVDKYYSPYSRNTITLFEGLLIQKSLFGSFVQALDLDLPLPSYNYHREVVRYTFDQLPQIVTQPGPKFVLAHILLPHPPFSFHEDGSPNNPDRPFSIKDASDFEGTAAEYIQGYSEQLKFANNEIPMVIQGIMDNSTRPFVILLQGDHGGGAYLDFDTFDANDCFVERFSILNAYYFSPGPGRVAALSQLTPDITPVNSFRVLLNAYMGTNYELLPGRQYYSTDSDNLELIDVTEQTTSECRVSD